MFTPLSTGIDPRFYRGLLRGRELEIRFRWWHQLIRILGKNERDDFALRALARNDDLLLDIRLHIQPQLGFARVGIRAVALETVVRENRQHIPVEIRRSNRGSRQQQNYDEQEAQHRLEFGGRASFVQSGAEVN